MQSVDHGVDPAIVSKVEAERSISSEELAEVEAMLKELWSGTKPSDSVRAVVEDRIFARSVLSFGRVEYRAPDRGADRTIFRYRDGQIVEEGYNPADPPLTSRS